MGGEAAWRLHERIKVCLGCELELRAIPGGRKRLFAFERLTLFEIGDRILAADRKVGEGRRVDLEFIREGGLDQRDRAQRKNRGEKQRTRERVCHNVVDPRMPRLVDPIRL